MKDPHQDALSRIKRLKLDGGNPAAYRYLFRCISRDIERGELKLDDLETSEAELEALRIQGSRISAHSLLKTLRERRREYRAAGGIELLHLLLEEDIKTAGLTLADLGTSNDELARLSTVLPL